MAKKGSAKKIIATLLVVLFIVAGGLFYWYYGLMYKANVTIEGKKSLLVNIPTNSTFEDVVQLLVDKKIIKDTASFIWMAKQKNYDTHVHPGRYRIMANMNNKELVNLLRFIENQEKVVFTFNSIHTKEELVSRVCDKLEADADELSEMLNNRELLAPYGLNPTTVLTFFIPDSYEYYWNTSAEQFFKHSAEIYQSFWNEQRRAKAKQLGLTPVEVAILASIVQSEQSKYNDEKPIIAGVYINRLRIDMALQSDPTIKYALGDYERQRILAADLTVESPYNTYKNKGLPPGPICLPLPNSIDAVLNYQKHNYIYMCAKDDLSGRHYFAKNLDQHIIYARKYRAALDNRNILH